MSIPIIGDIIDEIGDLASEVLVDKDKRDELNVRLRELADKADAREHEARMGQLEINKVEAQHSSLFVAGWRPFIGWASGAGFVYAVIVRPTADWIAKLTGYTGDFPIFDTDLLYAVMMGMLGIGAMRTVEKVNGVERNTIKAHEKLQEENAEKPKKKKKFLGIF